MLPRLDWIRRVRRQAVGTVLCATLLVVTTLALSTAPWLPVVGVALAAVAVTVHKMTHRIHHADAACLSCSRDLSEEPTGVHGIICPDCGAVHSGSIRHLARLDALPTRTHAETQADSDEQA